LVLFLVLVNTTIIRRNLKLNHVVLIGYHSTANALFDMGNIGDYFYLK